MSEMKDPEPFEVDQHITANSRYFAGTIGSLFYTTLRDEKRILGVRCKTCDKVLWPPRSTCGRCFSLLGERDLVEIGPEGTLETFTRIDYTEPVHPKPAPLIYGIIKLDGADTGMTHLIEGVPFETLHIGMRMKPVFAEERKADILDIAYFTAAKIIRFSPSVIKMKGEFVGSSHHVIGGETGNLKLETGVENPESNLITDNG